MKTVRLLTFTVITLLGFNLCHGQDSLSLKTYEFGLYNNFDLRNSSTNFISTHRLLTDAFASTADAKLKPKTANISKGIFNFATTYLTMLWSHEIGHYIRAKQVGGRFNIHNFGLPVPYTTADLPSNISLTDRAIFVTAGFEVNYLNVRNIQSRFIRHNGMKNEELALSFANRFMYPIYTSLVVPINPEDKNVWIETAGDPVHYILPVFENYSNNNVFNPDSTVNPELVKFYNQASIFATFFNLLDPQFYREAAATFGKSTKVRKPMFLFGNYENGWTYGTLFNASPLGYELYFQNYIHINKKQYGLYVKYGRPFKNIGLGFTMNHLIKTTTFNADLSVEFWQQDLFGEGVSVELSGRWKFSNHLGAFYNLGYKTRGYLLGKQLDQGLNIGTGICIYR